MPIKVKELAALLEADGWLQVRQRGSHRQYHHATKPGTVTLSGKPSVDVPPGTLNTQQRSQAGRAEEVRSQMQYLVVIEQGPSSFGAYVPDLPGCVAAGETREEVTQLIHEAIEFHLDGMKEDGLPIPQPHSSSEFIEVRV